MTDILRPCPFCGGEADVQQSENFGDNRGMVLCLTCLSCSNDCDTWQEAIAAWNTRHDGWILVAGQEPPKDKDFLIYGKHRLDNEYSVIHAYPYEGRIYANSREAIIDWEDGITDFTHWKPIELPSPEK